MNNSLIISLLFLIVGCSKLIDEPSLIEKNGVMYLPQSDKPYSGDVSKSDNFGKTLLKGTYKNGKKDGLWTWWYENGQKLKEETYKGGKEDRSWTSWYKNGQKKFEGISKDGKRDGLWTDWDENGKNLKEETYKDGELISQECWDEDVNEKECD